MDDYSKLWADRKILLEGPILANMAFYSKTLYLYLNDFSKVFFTKLQITEIRQRI